jgi:DNA-binding CsgD family transcriptional regulator
VLSKTERQFLEKLQKKSGEIAVREEYAIDYVRQLKHRILKKRKSLTDDLLLINAVLDKLQSL